MSTYYAEVIARATALALVLVVPPILGLLYIWETGARDPIPIIAWLVLTLLWNTLVIAALVREKTPRARRGEA
jgi:putative effector of murein hydrolase LrgA (UPF0299 family)